MTSRAADNRGAAKSPWRLLLGPVAVLLVAVVVVVLYGWRAPSSDHLSDLVKPRSAAGFNVLLVTLDTVRPDHLGCYGYDLAETPTIDGLAACGVQFDDAVTPVPVTLPSHATMLTGLYPPNHGVRDNGLFQLAPEHVTLAETLKTQGYETAAFVACFVVDAVFGLAQGFDVYDFEVAREGYFPQSVDFNQRPASAVTTSAVKWLEQRQAEQRTAPFFMWVHYFDAHVPYISPYQKLSRFRRHPYDGEIAYVDSQFKRLIETLDRTGLRDRTLIALVSDHGEGLGAHDEPTHGMLLYDSTIRVAFILSCQGLFKEPARVGERVVSLVDLRPTLEELLGLPISSGDGMSLLAEQHDPARAVYLETKVPYHSAGCSPLYGLRRHHDKYIDAPEPEYYSLRGDPGELDNRCESERAQAASLLAQLQALRQTWDAAETAGDPGRNVSAEDVARLQSLGYTGSTPAFEPAELPDPKALVAASLKISEAQELRKQGRLDEAERLAREAVNACPAFTHASRALASICEERHKPEEAVALLRKSFEVNPHAAAALDLAGVLLRLQRLDEVEPALTQAAALDPYNGAVNILRGDLFMLRQQYQQALSEYREALRLDRHRVGPIALTQIQKIEQHLHRTP